jgi:hypothetical protein
MAYAIRSDLYLYGVPRGALVAQGLRTDRALASDDLIAIGGHGFETGDAVVVRVDSGSTLPVPLTDGMTVYVIRINDQELKLATSALNAQMGTPIDLTADLIGTMVLAPSLDAAVDAILEDWARAIDDKIPHLIPLTPPYPTRVVSINARGAAYDVLGLLGRRNDSTLALKLDALRDLDRYASGISIQDSRATEEEQLAIGSSPDPTEMDCIP